jgi:hypothetical protein
LFNFSEDLRIMTLSRDSRMDRRRRVLLDASSAEQAEVGTKRVQATEQNVKRGPSYSQDVRQACGTRLVQLIPIRKRSFVAVVLGSVLITASLILFHYLIYVSGRLTWYGHPLALLLDATHQQSIAVWLGSHLWLLCLVATVLTFQLRRHKLDDYQGEYRLWFWLVITCLIASLDSTTRITELFGMALDKWTKLNIGWSGNAVVVATMATLIGMLGLRLCSELKTVPLSLSCWLIGLVAWAGSAVLAQDNFRVDITIQTRLWLRASLWLGGLTSIWIAAVAYLRHVYMEAQQRFLARGLLAKRAEAVPLTERMRQTIPFIRRNSLESQQQAVDGQQPQGGKRWALSRLFARRGDESQAATVEPVRREKPSVKPIELKPESISQAARPETANSPRPQLSHAGPLSPANRGQSLPNASQNTVTASAPGVRSTTGPTSPLKPVAAVEAAESETKRRWPFAFKLWPGKDIPEEEAIEYRKLRNEEREKRVEQKRLEKEAAQAEKAAAKQARLEQRRAASEVKQNTPNEANPTGRARSVGKKLLGPVVAAGSLFKKIKLPSLKSLQLKPPAVDAEDEVPATSNLRPVSQDKPTVGNSRPGTSPPGNYDEAEEDDDRYLSKAERKKRRHGRAA